MTETRQTLIGTDRNPLDSPQRSPALMRRSAARERVLIPAASALSVLVAFALGIWVAHSMTRPGRFHNPWVVVTPPPIISTTIITQAPPPAMQAPPPVIPAPPPTAPAHPTAPAARPKPPIPSRPFTQRKPVPPAPPVPPSPVVTESLPVGRVPQGIAINPVTNRVYVANAQSDDVTVIDGRKKVVVATIPVGQGPYGVAVDTTRDEVFVTSTDGYLYVLDGSTNQVMGKIAVGQEPEGVVADAKAGRVYVANYGGDPTAPGLVTVIDEASRSALQNLMVGSHPRGLALDELHGYLFVTCAGSSSLEIINTADGTVLRTTRLESVPAGVAFDPQTGAAYVATARGCLRFDSGAGNPAPAGIAGDNLTVVAPFGPLVYSGGPDGLDALGTPVANRQPGLQARSEPLGIAVNPRTAELYYTSLAPHGTIGPADPASTGRVNWMTVPRP